MFKKLFLPTVGFVIGFAIALNAAPQGTKPGRRLPSSLGSTHQEQTHPAVKEKPLVQEASVVESESAEPELTSAQREALRAGIELKQKQKDRLQSQWDLPVELDSDVEIAKIHTFLNDPSKVKTGNNPALIFEGKYRNHGAVTKKQKRDKEGYYYTVSWENHGNPANFILRLDYRQADTKDLVHTLEIPFPQAEGDQEATFTVTGEAYAKRGAVKSWRISVIRDGAIVAQEKSYIW